MSDVQIDFQSSVKYLCRRTNLHWQNGSIYKEIVCVEGGEGLTIVSLG